MFKDLKVVAYSVVGILSLVGYEFVHRYWPSARVKFLNKLSAKKVPVVIRFSIGAGETARIGTFAEAYHAYIVEADDESVVIAYTEEETGNKRLAVLAQKQIIAIITETEEVYLEMMR